MKLKRLEVTRLNDCSEKVLNGIVELLEQSTEASAQYFEEEYKDFLVVLIPWMSVAFHFSCMT